MLTGVASATGARRRDRIDRVTGAAAEECRTSLYDLVPASSDVREGRGAESRNKGTGDRDERTGSSVELPVRSSLSPTREAVASYGLNVPL